MASKEDDFVAAYIKRSLKLSRAIEGQTNKIGRDINQLHSSIMDKIERQYPKLTMQTLSKLNREIARDISDFHSGSVRPAVTSASNAIIEKEIVWNVETINQFVATQAIIINSPKVADKALKTTFQGHTFDFWFRSAGKTSAKKVTNLLRNGYVLGATPAETARHIKSVLNRSGNDIKTLSRSYFQHAAAEARYQTFDQNKDLIAEYVWDSTLDSRTTPHICGIRDLKRYDINYEPIGHNIPWDAGPGRIHFNCRSSFIPRLKGMGDLTDSVKRHAFTAGDEYKAGDNLTRNGRVRKPTRKNVEKGIFKSQNVRAGTTYEDMLKRQKVSYIADVLGSKQAATDFKAGRISLLDFAKAGSASDLNNL